MLGGQMPHDRWHALMVFFFVTQKNTRRELVKVRLTAQAVVQSRRSALWHAHDEELRHLLKQSVVDDAAAVAQAPCQKRR
jgi:hypothetical protein